MMIFGAIRGRSENHDRNSEADMRVQGDVRGREVVAQLPNVEFVQLVIETGPTDLEHARSPHPIPGGLL